MKSNVSADSSKKDFFDSVEIKGLSAKSARAFSSGRLAGTVRFISRLFAYTSARVYGFASLSFGLLTLFLHLGEYYFRDNPQVRFSSLIIGAVFTILSTFLLVSDKPISIALQSSKITDFIVFEFFSVNRMQASEQEHKLPAVAGIVFGFLLALLGFFFPTEYAVLLVVSLVFFTMTMTSPEFTHIFVLLCYPYISLAPHSHWVLAAVTLLLLVSFARKVLVGKRVYALEIYDVLLGFFILAALIVSALLGDELAIEKSLFTAIFIIGYIPAANIAVNRRLCDCISSSIVVSSIPVSVYAIVKYAINLFLDKRTPSSAWFSSPRELAVFLSVALLFAAYLSAERSHTYKKVYYAIAASLASVAILTTEYFIIPVVILVGMLAFFVIRSKKLPKILLFPILLLPFAVCFIPRSVLDKISDLLNLSVGIYDEMLSYVDSVKLFFENLFLGTGDMAFSDSPVPMQNTYIGIASRFGILAVIVMLIVMTVRVMHIGVCKKYFSDSVVGFYVDMATLATVLMLLFGCFVDIFVDVTSVYFFVSIFAMGSSALRISKKEKDQRLSYYKDSRSFESAVIDVNIRA